MSAQQLIDIMNQAMILALILAAPCLGLALAVGLVVSIFQAVTSIQEQSLTFVPKIVVIALTLVVTMGWMARLLVTFTANVIMQTGNVVP